MLMLEDEAEELLNIVFRVSRVPHGYPLTMELFILVLEGHLVRFVRERPSHATAAESVLRYFESRFGAVAPERKRIVLAAIGTYVGNLMIRIAVL